jgi:hypothetical protein
MAENYALDTVDRNEIDENSLSSNPSSFVRNTRNSNIIIPPFVFCFWLKNRCSLFPRLPVSPIRAEISPDSVHDPTLVLPL